MYLLFLEEGSVSELYLFASLILSRSISDIGICKLVEV